MTWTTQVWRGDGEEVTQQLFLKSFDGLHKIEETVHHPRVLSQKARFQWRGGRLSEDSSIWHPSPAHSGSRHGDARLTDRSSLQHQTISTAQHSTAQRGGPVARNNTDLRASQPRVSHTTSPTITNTTVDDLTTTTTTTTTVEKPRPASLPSQFHIGRGWTRVNTRKPSRPTYHKVSNPTARGRVL